MRRLGPTHKERPSSSSSFLCGTLATSTFLQASMSLPALAAILPRLELASNLSEVDAEALSKLSDAAQVRAWTRRTMATYKKYISTLLDIHNSVAPINDLPSKILQKIFTYVASKSRYPSRCDPTWMLSLQLVCSRWRSVLLATPEYWVQGIGYIMDLFNEGLLSDSGSDSDEEGVGTQLLDLFLERSAPCPLELEMAYTSTDDCPGWQIFENHFDRVTVFEVEARSAADLRNNILYTVATEMKRLERFQLDASGIRTSTKGLKQWTAKNLPHLGHITIPGPLFCCATTVPSLHTIVLTGKRDIESLPSLLDALERCSALASLTLCFASDEPDGDQKPRGTPERIVDLPNLLQLDVTGTTSGLYSFLSSLSFPPSTLLSFAVTNVYLTNRDSLPVLPKILPPHHSGLYAPPYLDRLCLHTGIRRHWYDRQPKCISMRGYVQGQERLRVGPVLPELDSEAESADCVLQFLDAFSACTLTELALDLRHLASDMDAAFWARFFGALPDLRRLELLSPTVESRATKRDIAQQFLRAVASQNTPEVSRGTSLAWVLRVDNSTGSGSSLLEEELSDVQAVLSGHAESGGRLERLELYVVASEPDSCSPQPVDVAQVLTDDTASQLVTGAYISGLEAVVDEVVVGGEWGFDSGSEDWDDDPELDVPLAASVGGSED